MKWLLNALSPLPNRLWHMEEVLFSLSFVSFFYFSTIWKYSQLNLEELRGRGVPTFPCLKFPSNGVIHSLSFPFYTWVGEERDEASTGAAAWAELPDITGLLQCRLLLFTGMVRISLPCLLFGLFWTAGVCPGLPRALWTLSRDWLPSATRFFSSITLSWLEIYHKFCKWLDRLALSSAPVSVLAGS